MMGDPPMIVITSVTALGVVWPFSIGWVGHFAGFSNWAIGCCLRTPVVGVLLQANAFPHAIWSDVIGAIISIVLIAAQLGLHSRKLHQVY
jgi:hypothetical protein